MNIGIFTDTYYPEVNGVANSVYELKIGLEALGHRVYVFTVNHPDAIEAEERVYRIMSFPCVLLKERRIGCPNVKFWMKRIGQLHLDIIHTQTEFMVGCLGKKAAQTNNIPLVHTYHTIYEDYTHYFKIPGNIFLKRPVRAVSKKYCNRADSIIVPTKKVSQLLKSYGVERNIWEVASGINLKKFRMYDAVKSRNIRMQYGISDEQRVLISIGRISKEKNLAEVVEGYAGLCQTHSDTVLMIVGDGPERINIETQVRTLGLESRVIFTGMVEWDQIENYYGAGDIFVSASTSETQGLTYLEALASGKPLLVRNDPCLDGLLKNRENGIGYDNYEEYSEGYRYITENLLDRKEEFYVNDLQRFGEEQFAGEVQKVYEKTLQDKWRLKNGYHELFGTA